MDISVSKPSGSVRLEDRQGFLDTDACNTAQSDCWGTGILCGLCLWIVCFGIGGENSSRSMEKEVFSIVKYFA